MTQLCTRRRPVGYRAQFTPLLDVLAPDGSIIARDGAPITTACELGSRLVSGGRRRRARDRSKASQIGLASLAVGVTVGVLAALLPL